VESLEYRDAAGFTTAELSALWNQGYEGYFVPIAFDEAQLAAHLRSGDIDLARSVVLVDGELPVGFSLLGVRGERGWIGGFGIAPSHRGQALSYPLFAEHVRRIREDGPAHVQLEVFEQNWARKVYEAAGFHVTRRLPYLVGAAPMSGEALSAAEPMELLAHHARLHGAHPASWNRETGWLAHRLPAAGASAMVDGPSEAPTAYLIYLRTADAVRVFDVAAESAEAAARLVSGLGALAPGESVTVVNEPEGSPVERAFRAAGWTEHSAQLEMHWDRP
jgi:ribosomal protein S18 acetylase RimI-like enzyme